MKAQNILMVLVTIALGGCGGEGAAGDARQWSCLLEEGDAPDFTLEVGCSGDFEVLSARPKNASISGARSTKVIVDRATGESLFFINTKLYPRHFDFAAAHLSDEPLPAVFDLSLFNQTEYRSPDRRFLLGAVTHYEAPDIWAYEIAPYDAASPQMVETAMRLIIASAHFGPRLRFHPTSAGTRAMAAGLADWVSVVSTEEIFEDTAYQPLNLGESYGQLRFMSAEALDSGYVGPRDIVVLDTVPNDISVIAGLITAEVQTPLSHVNVLAQNRGTPNMALRGAFDDPALRALENQWVHLVVGAFEYTLEGVGRAQAEAWWEENKPPAVQVPALDVDQREIKDVKALDLTSIPAYGGKASNYGILANIGDEVPVPKAFGVPVFYYKQFEAQNGFDAHIAGLQAEDRFLDDPSYRARALLELQAAMMDAPVDPEFEAMLMARLQSEHAGLRMRFRSSTNAEDLDGFTGAGLYSSASGEIGDPRRAVLDAVRFTWASLWNFRAYEERDFRGIPHDAVAMALLVHHAFPDEEANGVALTNNPFDPSQPAFYVNVQVGEFSVVSPEPGVTVDAYLHFFHFPGQPTTFLSKSNLISQGRTVLSPTQISELGRALSAIHEGFAPTYEKADVFYAMDVEFKFDDLDTGDSPGLWVKQARPHPGWAAQP